MQAGILKMDLKRRDGSRINSMSTRTLLTTEQFEGLPEPEVGGYELDRGELVYVSPNDLRHNRIRDNLYIPLREFVPVTDWVRPRRKHSSSLPPGQPGRRISLLWVPLKSGI